MDVVDTNIEAPERDTDKPFLMPVEDVNISLVVVLYVLVVSSVVSLILVMRLTSLVFAKAQTTVTGIEMFRKILDEGQAGDNAGILLRGIKRDDVERGQVLYKRTHICSY